MDRVISSLGVDVWPQLFYQCGDAGLIENDHVVDRGQRRQDLGTISFIVNRSSGALKLPHRLITIKPNHQPAAQFLGRLQIAHVTDMENIKTTIGENDLFRRIFCPQARCRGFWQYLQHALKFAVAAYESKSIAIISCWILVSTVLRRY